MVALFKLLLHEQVRSDYNQTWIIGALWEPSLYDAFQCHMTRSKVIGGQIVAVIWRQIVIVMVALFQIAPAWTGSLRLQPNLNHRCTMGTFMLWLHFEVTWQGQMSLQVNFTKISINILSEKLLVMRSFMFDILQGDMTRSKVILTFTCLKMYIARSGDTSGSRTTLSRIFHKKFSMLHNILACCTKF